MEDHVVAVNETCVSVECSADDDEESSVQERALNVNTFALPDAAAALTKSDATTGLHNNANQEECSKDEAQATANGSADILWENGLFTDRTSSRHPPPFHQQFPLAPGICDSGNGCDAFARLVPPLSARSSVRRAHMSISISTNAGAGEWTSAMNMPDVRVGLTPTETTAPNPKVFGFEPLPAATIAIPIGPPEAFVSSVPGHLAESFGPKFQAPPSQPHALNSQRLPYPKSCSCSSGRHRSLRLADQVGRTPLEELDEWRQHACPQALPHLDYLASCYRAEARLAQGTGPPLAAEKQVLIQNQSAALGISLVALLLFPPLGLMAFALALSAMGLKRARRVQLADCLAFFSAKLTLFACSFGTVCTLIILIYGRYVYPQSNAPSTPFVGVVNANLSLGLTGAVAGADTNSDRLGGLSKLSPGIFAKPGEQQEHLVPASGGGAGGQAFTITTRQSLYTSGFGSNGIGADGSSVDPFAGATPPAKIVNNAGGPTRYVWPYATHTPDDPMFDSDTMFPGKNMLVGKRMGAGFVRNNG